MSINVAINTIEKGSSTNDRGLDLYRPRIVQVVRGSDQWSYIVISDKETEALAFITPSAREDFKKQNPKRTFAGLKTCLVKVDRYIASFTALACDSFGGRLAHHIQEGGSRNVDLPICLQCADLAFVGAEGCNIFGTPQPLNGRQPIRDRVRILGTVAAVTQQLAKAQGYQTLPDASGHSVIPADGEEAPQDAGEMADMDQQDEASSLQAAGSVLNPGLGERGATATTGIADLADLEVVEATPFATSPARDYTTQPHASQEAPSYHGEEDTLLPERQRDDGHEQEAGSRYTELQQPAGGEAAPPSVLAADEGPGTPPLDLLPMGWEDEDAATGRKADDADVEPELYEQVSTTVAHTSLRFQTRNRIRGWPPGPRHKRARHVLTIDPADNGEEDEAPSNPFASGAPPTDRLEYLTQQLSPQREEEMQAERQEEPGTFETQMPELEPTQRDEDTVDYRGAKGPAPAAASPPSTAAMETIRQQMHTVRALAGPVAQRVGRQLLGPGGRSARLDTRVRNQGSPHRATSTPRQRENINGIRGLETDMTPSPTARSRYKPWREPGAVAWTNHRLGSGQRKESIWSLMGII